MFDDDDIIDFNQEIDDLDELESTDPKDNKKKSDKKDRKDKKKKGIKGKLIGAAVTIVILVALYCTAAYSNIPFIKDLRTLYIETALGTKDHQWLATAFLPKSVVDKVLAEKRANIEQQKEYESKWEEEKNTEAVPDTEEVEDTVDPQDAFFEEYWEIDSPSVRNYLKNNPSVSGDYTSVFIEDFDGSLGLETKNGDSIFAIDQKNNTIIVALHKDKYEGKLAIVKDPKQVELKKASNYGRRGDLIADYGKRYNAVVAINSSGFKDPGGHGNGSQVAGCMIIDGVDYGKEFHDKRKFYGMKYDNKLYIENYWTIKESEYKWGVQFQPALIVNGECVVDGTYGMGIQPRTAVGQAKDGTFLMLVVDGRQVGYSLGCSVKTCADVLMAYGATQAANFDGGSSSIMWYNGNQITKPSSVSKVGRYLPDALLILRAGE